MLPFLHQKRTDEYEQTGRRTEAEFPFMASESYDGPSLSDGNGRRQPCQQNTLYCWPLINDRCIQLYLFTLSPSTRLSERDRQILSACRDDDCFLSIYPLIIWRVITCNFASVNLKKRNIPAKLREFPPIFAKMADLAGCGSLLLLPAGRTKTAKIQTGRNNFTHLCTAYACLTSSSC